MKVVVEEQNLGAFLAETLDQACPFPEVPQVHCLVSSLALVAVVVPVLPWVPDQALQFLFLGLG